MNQQRRPYGFVGMGAELCAATPEAEKRRIFQENGAFMCYGTLKNHRLSLRAGIQIGRVFPRVTPSFSGARWSVVPPVLTEGQRSAQAN
jgi:hypothetical protein